MFGNLRSFAMMSISEKLQAYLQAIPVGMCMALVGTMLRQSKGHIPHGRVPIVVIDLADEDMLDVALRALDTLREGGLPAQGSLGRAVLACSQQSRRAFLLEIDAPPLRVATFKVACGAQEHGCTLGFIRCASCNADKPSLRLCTGCFLTPYCDTNCSHAHWAEHKQRCKHLARVQQNVEALF